MVGDIKERSIIRKKQQLHHQKIHNIGICTLFLENKVSAILSLFPEGNLGTYIVDKVR